MDTPLSSRKHKKLKRDNGDASESSDSPGPTHSSSASTVSPSNDEESIQSVGSSIQRKVKKKKKKKRAREPSIDESSENGLEAMAKRRKVIIDDSSLDGVSIEEDSLSEPLQESSKESETTPKKKMTVHQVTREPRQCVQLLRQKQNKSPLQRLLDFLHKELENKDPQQFFAWPVTDQIAPNYSSIISRPMDFSTMKQKIDDNIYQSLSEYVNDLNLMCNNAMIYNRPDTIYYKAAKRLLHGAGKLLSQEKIRHLSSILIFIKEIPSDQLGFVLYPSSNSAVDEVMEVTSPTNLEDLDEGTSSKNSSIKRTESTDSSEAKMDISLEEKTSESIPDPPKVEESEADKLSLKKVNNNNMGFARQQQDGSTSLAIFVPGDSVDPTRPKERAVTLGQLVGKLSHGTGSLLGFREDKRNLAKPVRPLQYGPFSSYAPSYDSTFSNITKEDSDLIYETYCEDTSPSLIESSPYLAKDCDYTTLMVDNILDILTGGEHKKSKEVIEDQRRVKEDNERIKSLLETKPTSVHEILKPDISTIKVEFDQLRTLSDLGIDTSFLDKLEPSKEEAAITEKLNQTTVLLEKLQQLQNDRLSSVPPPHLSHIMAPSDVEISLAEKIAEQLVDLARDLPPAAITPLAALRKAMGIVPDSNDEENPETICLDNDKESENEEAESPLRCENKDEQKDSGMKEKDDEVVELNVEIDDIEMRDSGNEAFVSLGKKRKDSVLKANTNIEAGPNDNRKESKVKDVQFEAMQTDGKEHGFKEFIEMASKVVDMISPENTVVESRDDQNLEMIEVVQFEKTESGIDTEIIDKTQATVDNSVPDEKDVDELTPNKKENQSKLLMDDVVSSSTHLATDEVCTVPEPMEQAD